MNVVHVLAVFVGLQLLLLVLFVPAVLLRWLFRLIPGDAAVQESLQLLSPARLQGAIARLLPQRHRGGRGRVGAVHRSALAGPGRGRMMDET